MYTYLNYYDGPVREICHKIKESKTKKERSFYVNAIAEYVMNGNLIDDKSVLIPVPQHSGSAIYTKEICEVLAHKTGAKIADIIRCAPHEPLYEVKKRGGTCQVNYYLTSRIPAGKLFLIDNVISSGQTIFEIQNVLNKKVNPVVYAIDYSRFTELAKLKEIVPDGFKLNDSRGQVVLENI